MKITISGQDVISIENHSKIESIYGYVRLSILIWKTYVCAVIQGYFFSSQLQQSAAFIIKQWLVSCQQIKNFVVVVE